MPMLTATNAVVTNIIHCENSINQSLALRWTFRFINFNLRVYVYSFP